jgi:hypothetical protein
MGGFEILKEISDFNKAQPTSEAEDLSNNLCPDCDWPLSENSEGVKACPICGKIWR